MISSIDSGSPAQHKHSVISAERRQELTSELEHRLLVLADQLRTRTATAAAEIGLTPQQAIVVRYLEPGLS